MTDTIHCSPRHGRAHIRRRGRAELTAGALGLLLGCGIHASTQAASAQAQPERQATIADASEQVASTTASVEPHGHAHADTGNDLVARVPGPSLTLTNISTNTVTLELDPVLLGPDHTILTAAKAVDVDIAPGNSYSFAPTFEVTDGFYTVDIEMHTSSVDNSGAPIEQDANVEWRVEITDHAPVTANDDAWLAALMHIDTQVGGSQ